MRIISQHACDVTGHHITFKMAGALKCNEQRFDPNGNGVAG